MSSRIIKLPEETLRDILKAWTSSIPRMFDHDRTVESCFAPLVDEPTTFWYALPQGAYMIIRNVQHGAAVLQFITQDGNVVPSLPETQATLKEAVRENQLRRLTIVAPSSIAWRDYKLLGFQHEGRLRKSLLFNEEWADAEILGALEHEIGVSKKRFRKRRPKKVNHAPRHS